mmetsp:Transcript_40202/g.55806  ORF Transcript_40202/g.55806 Transcript_40202/m.55806 type:complete len:120 (+) Transcript_40202:70-429(+)
MARFASLISCLILVSVVISVSNIYNTQFKVASEVAEEAEVAGGGRGGRPGIHRKLLDDVRFMLDAAPYGFLQKFNYKLLNTDMKQYRSLTKDEKKGPFTFTNYQGKFVGSAGKLQHSIK